MSKAIRFFTNTDLKQLGMSNSNRAIVLVNKLYEQIPQEAYKAALDKFKPQDSYFKQLQYLAADFTTERYGVKPSVGTAAEIVWSNKNEAFRHAYTSAVSARLKGEYLADQFGQINEVRHVEILGDLKSNPAKAKTELLDANRDLYNNKFGRDIASNTAFSIDQLSTAIFNSIDAGNLITDPQAGWDQGRVAPEFKTYSKSMGNLFMPDLHSRYFYEQESKLFWSNWKASQNLFNKAPNLTGYGPSPLILDLDGDGIKTTSYTKALLFDHDGNGFGSRQKQAA
jgi:hypothetical protein